MNFLYEGMGYLLRTNFIKERILSYLNDSKHSIWLAICEIFDILASGQNAKMLVGEYPQPPISLLGRSKLPWQRDYAITK